MSRWLTERPRQIDKPEPGFFKMRLVSKGPLVPARIHRVDDAWAAEINGIAQVPGHTEPERAAGVMQIWQSAERIDEAEYDYLLKLSWWAKEHDPAHPLASPTQPINVNRMPPPF
jgi:hypothetical protein